MGPIPCSKECILVKIKFDSRPVLMSKHHDSLLFMVLYREALDRLLCSFEHVPCFYKTYLICLNAIHAVAGRFFVLADAEIKDENFGCDYDCDTNP